MNRSRITVSDHLLAQVQQATQKLAFTALAAISFGCACVAGLGAVLIAYLHLVLEGSDFSGSSDLTSIVLLGALTLLFGLGGRMALVSARSV